MRAGWAPWSAGVLAVLILGRSVAADESPWAWPLDTKPALSSSFGESRASAFHAGIDLKTWGKTGYAVKAAAAGHIVRVRTSPWGYGKALYLRLADGRTLVYAHLESFADDIARRVRKAQKARGRYTVDLWLKAGEVAVRRGQVIARSGQSGAGPPHLHFELRDAQNVPLNPQLHGFAVKDSTAPTLTRIALAPMGRQGRVNGGHRPVSVGLRYNAASGFFESAIAPVVFGPVGVAVNGWDRADAAQNKLAPWRHRLAVEGVERFRATYDKVAYADAYQVLLDRWTFDGDGRRYFALFRLPGNRLSFYEMPAGGNGIPVFGGEDLPKGRRLIEVTAEDVAGNVSRARIWVRVDRVPEVTAGHVLRQDGGGLYLEAQVTDADDRAVFAEVAWSADGTAWTVVQADSMVLGGGPYRWDLGGQQGLWRLRVRDGAGAEALGFYKTEDKAPVTGPGAEDGAQGQGKPSQASGLAVQQTAYRDFVVLDITTEATPLGPPEVAADSVVLPIRSLGLRHWQATVPLANGEPLAVTVRLDGGTAGLTTETIQLGQTEVGRQETVWEVAGVRLHFPEDSVYQALFPQATPFVPQKVPADLEDTGIGWALGPEGPSFNRRVAVWMRYPEGYEGVDKLGLYAPGAGGKWYFAGNEFNAACGCVGTKVRRLGRYALLADRQVPTIEILTPVFATKKPRRPRLVARIADTGAGIGREEDIVVQLDGKPLIAEYDPEAGTVRGLLDRDLAAGAHRLSVRVRDRSGNEAVAEQTFDVE